MVVILICQKNMRKKQMHFISGLKKIDAAEVPAGVLLPIIANHKVKWYRALLFGVLVSAIIETSQCLCVDCSNGMI